MSDEFAFFGWGKGMKCDDKKNVDLEGLGSDFVLFFGELNCATVERVGVESNPVYFVGMRYRIFGE